MLTDLIQAGVIDPPLDLYRTYRGHRLAARVEADGSVTVGTESYGSLSAAAGVARASVGGTPRGGLGAQVNGWTFWHFTDLDGKSKAVQVLRQRHGVDRG